MPEAFSGYCTLSGAPIISMARLQRLFRRLSSRGDTSPDYSSSPPSTPASSGLTSLPPKTQAYVAGTPRALRKTKSLPKLRKKFGVAATEIPEAVEEQRESLQLSPAAETESVDRVDTKSRTTSGSETLGGGRSRERVVLEVEQEKTASEVSTTELRLERADSPPEKPVVVVEAPTPDVAEELTAVQKRDVR